MYIYNTLWLILTEKYGVFLPIDWWKPEPTKTALRAGQSPHHLVDLQNYHYSPVRCGIVSLDPRALKTPQSCYIFVTEPPETKNAKCVNSIETPGFLCSRYLCRKLFQPGSSKGNFKPWRNTWSNTISTCPSFRERVPFLLAFLRWKIEKT